MGGIGPALRVRPGTRGWRWQSPAGRRGPVGLSAAVPATALNLSHAGHYLHWGVVQVSLANLIVIASMVAVFVVALLVPFPGHRRKP